MVWGGFVLAMALTGWACADADRPQLEGLPDGELAHLISSAFTLAKTLRDAYMRQTARRPTKTVRTAGATHTAPD